MCCHFIFCVDYVYDQTLVLTKFKTYFKRRDKVMQCVCVCICMLSGIRDVWLGSYQPA